MVTRSGLTCFRLACEEYSRSPYSPLRRVFRRLLDVADDAPQEVALEQLRERVRTQAPALEAHLPTLTNVLDIRMPPTPEAADIDPRFGGQFSSAPPSSCCAPASPRRPPW